MADKIGYKPNVTDGNTKIPLTFKDMADGTFAEVLAFDAGPITIGTVDQGDAGVEAWLASIQAVKGAANYANGQVTAGAASGALVGARVTRRSVTIRNQDAANSVYIGAGTVTSGNGLLLKAGESISIDTTAAINCIRATADVAVGYFETYD
jgi:hypothetical protein